MPTHHHATTAWQVRETVSLLSGARSLALDVTTKRVKYGFINVIGERWKPLRAMALLDILYVDEVGSGACAACNELTAPLLSFRGVAAGAAAALAACVSMRGRGVLRWRCASAAADTLCCVVIVCAPRCRRRRCRTCASCEGRPPPTPSSSSNARSERGARGGRRSCCWREVLQTSQRALAFCCLPRMQRMIVCEVMHSTQQHCVVLGGHTCNRTYH
jgi:hypothetical protein